MWFQTYSNLVLPKKKPKIYVSFSVSAKFNIVSHLLATVQFQGEIIPNTCCFWFLFGVAICLSLVEHNPFSNTRYYIPNLQFERTNTEIKVTCGISSIMKSYAYV